MHVEFFLVMCANRDACSYHIAITSKKVVTHNYLQEYDIIPIDLIYRNIRQYKFHQCIIKCFNFNPACRWHLIKFCLKEPQSHYYTRRNYYTVYDV